MSSSTSLRKVSSSSETARLKRKPVASEKPQLLTAKVNQMGMELRMYKWRSCQATIAEGDGWATLYFIESAERGKGHATELLKILKHIYRNVSFGGTVALNDTMKHLYAKLDITEYDDEAVGVNKRSKVRANTELLRKLAQVKPNKKGK